MISEETVKRACTCLFLACFASFIWGIYCFFRQPGFKARGMKVIQTLGLVMIVWHLTALIALPLGSALSGGLGVLLYLVALSLFWWAICAFKGDAPTLAFTDDTPTRLVFTGPYRFIRHPFYTSYLLAWTAGVAATQQWVLVVSVGLMGSLYLRAARMEELKFSSSNLAEAYSRYRKATGMFFPRLVQLAPWLRNRPTPSGGNG